MDIAKIIGTNLSALMQSTPALDTIKKIKARSGVGFGTIQRAAAGEGNITVQNLVAIAQAFGKQATDLMSHTVDEIREPEATYANVIEADLYRPAISDDEKTIIEAYRLFGEEMKQSWLTAAKSRIAQGDSAITKREPRKRQTL